MRTFTPKENRLRAKIIYEYCQMGYVLHGTKNPKTGLPFPDYDHINKSVMGLGANPRKVILNYLYESELLAVLNQVEQIYKKQLKNG